jgi:hypothetical protein
MGAVRGLGIAGAAAGDVVADTEVAAALTCPAGLDLEGTWPVDADADAGRAFAAVALAGSPLDFVGDDGAGGFLAVLAAGAEAGGAVLAENHRRFLLSHVNTPPTLEIHLFACSYCFYVVLVQRVMQ